MSSNRINKIRARKLFYLIGEYVNLKKISSLFSLEIHKLLNKFIYLSILTKENISLYIKVYFLESNSFFSSVSISFIIDSLYENMLPSHLVTVCFAQTQISSATCEINLKS